MQDSFDDVSNAVPQHYSTAVQKLQEDGVLEGYGDGSFRPEQSVNRAEFVKIVIGALLPDLPEASNCFPDVRSEWFAPYVCAAATYGVVAGYPSGMFHPEKEISFVEASKILVRSYGLPIVHVEEEHWFTPYVTILANRNAIPVSITTFEHTMTRAELSAMVYRIAYNVTDMPSTPLHEIGFAGECITLGRDECLRNPDCGAVYGASVCTEGKDGMPGICTADYVFKHCFTLSADQKKRIKECEANGGDAGSIRRSAKGKCRY